MYREIKLSLSSLLQNKSFLVCFTLVLGISLAGLISAISLYQNVLFQALPYKSPERLYTVNGIVTKDNKPFFSGALSAPAAYNIANNDVFESATPLFYDDILLTNEISMPLLKVTYSQSELFSLMNMPFALGGKFEDAIRPGEYKRQVVISYRVWQQEFSGEKDIIGKNITLADDVFNIVGVLSSQAHEAEVFQIGRQADVYLPFFSRLGLNLERNSNAAIWPELALLGLLKPNISINQAEQLILIEPQAMFLNTEISQTSNNEFLKFELIPIRQHLMGNSDKSSRYLLLATCGLLFIALVNIFGLYMMRLMKNKKALALRASVGASPRQLFMQLWLDSSLLFFISLVIAICFSQLFIGQIKYWGSGEFSLLRNLSITLFSVLIVIFVCFVLALVFAILSNKTINYLGLISQLQNSGKGSGIQISNKLKQGLLVCQLSLSLLLISGTCHVMLGAWQALDQSLGFDDDVLFITLDERDFNFSDKNLENKRNLALANLNMLNQLPEIQKASLSSLSPFLLNWITPINTKFDINTNINAYSNGVSSEYFSMLNHNIIAGRGFTKEEVFNNSEAVILNEQLAEKLDLSADDIGRKLFSRNVDKPYTLVGIVADINLPNKGVVDSLYIPVNFYFSGILIKVNKGSKLNKIDLSRLLKDVNPKARVLEIQHLKSFRKSVFKYQYLSLYSSLILGILAVFIATSGIYGLFKYQQQLQRNEIGIRMVLGANSRTILMDIFIRNSKALLISCVIAVVVLLSILFIFNFEFQMLGINFLIALVIISCVYLFSIWFSIKELVSSWPALHIYR